MRCEATVKGEAMALRASGDRERRCQRAGWVKVGQHHYCSQHADKLRADHRRILARIMAMPVRPSA